MDGYGIKFCLSLAVVNCAIRRDLGPSCTACTTIEFVKIKLDAVYCDTGICCVALHI